MLLFIVSRWGNRFDADGVDGHDTNFLVRAGSREAAAALVDDVLRYEAPPVAGRGIQPFAQCMTQIGEDAAIPDAAVLLGPFVTPAILREVPHDTWHRDAADGAWINVSAAHREAREEPRS